MPSVRHNPSSQAISFKDKLYLIDCGEGTQIQLRKQKLSLQKLGHIFISHIHGDHCLGLVGLISTLNLLGRTAQLHIHAPKELEHILSQELHTFCPEMSFETIFHAVDTKTFGLIHEDRSLKVYSLPLSHRLPCAGFLFRENPSLPHILRDMIDFYHIPFCEINNIKNGADFTLDDGTVIPCSRLTTPAEAPRSYAYCSDTIFLPKLHSYLENVDMLYHEATFGDEFLRRAQETFHSTARQAATVARDSNVKRLLIGHYSSRYETEDDLLLQAREVFPATELSCEGQTWEL